VERAIAHAIGTPCLIGTFDMAMAMKELEIYNVSVADYRALVLGYKKVPIGCALPPTGEVCP